MNCVSLPAQQEYNRQTTNSSASYACCFTSDHPSTYSMLLMLRRLTDWCKEQYDVSHWTTVGFKVYMRRVFSKRPSDNNYTLTQIRTLCDLHKLPYVPVLPTFSG
jgi:hypothetical protein